MNINFRNVGYFLEGGPMGPQDPNAMPPEGGLMPPEGGAPEEGASQGGGEDQLAQVAQQLVDMLMQQIGDPQVVGAVLQMALEMVQGGAEGGAPTPQEEPVYRMGGRLAFRLRRNY